jgi:two-component sensor histidine kinase
MGSAALLRPESLDEKITLSMSISVLTISVMALILWLTGALQTPQVGPFVDRDPTIFMSFILLAAAILALKASRKVTSLVLSLMVLALQFSGGSQPLHPQAWTVTSMIIISYSAAVILFSIERYSAAQIISYTAGTVAYALFLSEITGITETEPHFRACITSAAMMVFLAIGLLSTHPSHGVVEPLYSGRIGGYTGRMLIPIVIGSLTLTSFIVISGSSHIPFSADVFLATLNLALLIVIITFTAYKLNLVDYERIKNQRKSQRMWRFFRNVVDNLEEAVAVLDRNGEVLHSNTAMKNLELDLRRLWRENLDGKDLPQPIGTIRSGGRYFTGWAIPLDDGGIISLMDISGLVEVQEDLRSSLSEKEALLRELQHRVRNNLQIITSLINIQLQDADGPVKEALLATQTRVRAMTIIQESLYSTDGYSSVHIESCISRMTEHLKSLLGAHGVGFNIRADLRLNLETAMPLCLMVNELVTNAIKHAFPEGKGKVHIEIDEGESGYHMRFADDGIGFSGEGEGTGLKLVRILVEQLEGDLKILVDEEKGGTEILVPFRELQYRERT